MITTPEERSAVQQAAELERPLLAVEDCLAALGVALRQQDVLAVDRVAAQLHVALAAAVDHFGRAARRGRVPLPLRQRLALASGQVAAQREAIDVLMPRHAVAPASLYSASGGADRVSAGGGPLLA